MITGLEITRQDFEKLPLITNFETARSTTVVPHGFRCRVPDGTVKQYQAAYDGDEDLWITCQPVFTENSEQKSVPTSFDIQPLAKELRQLVESWKQGASPHSVAVSVALTEVANAITRAYGPAQK